MHTTGGRVVDQFVSPTQIGGTNIGGTGGLTSQTGQQIQAQVFVPGGSSTTGSIVAQKGSRKHRVTDGTLTGVCTLVNSPNVTSGQMNILVTLNAVSANVAAASANGGATSTFVTWTGTPTGVVATPRVGDYIIGFTGNAAVARVTAVNSASNVTIAITGNVGSQTGVNITTNTYAKRISNKFVHDFNNVKFRYRLAAATSTFVKVQSA